MVHPVISDESMAGNIPEETLEEWLIVNIPKEAPNEKLSRPTLEATRPAMKGQDLAKETHTLYRSINRLKMYNDDTIETWGYVNMKTTGDRDSLAIVSYQTLSYTTTENSRMSKM